MIPQSLRRHPLLLLGLCPCLDRLKLLFLCFKLPVHICHHNRLHFVEPQELSVLSLGELLRKDVYWIGGLGIRLERVITLEWFLILIDIELSARQKIRKLRDLAILQLGFIGQCLGMEPLENGIRVRIVVVGVVAVVSCQKLPLLVCELIAAGIPQKLVAAGRYLVFARRCCFAIAINDYLVVPRIGPHLEEGRWGGLPDGLVLCPEVAVVDHVEAERVQVSLVFTNHISLKNLFL